MHKWADRLVGMLCGRWRFCPWAAAYSSGYRNGVERGYAGWRVARAGEHADAVYIFDHTLEDPDA